MTMRHRNQRRSGASVIAAAAILCLALGGCTGFSYNHTGQDWTIVPGASLQSDTIRAARDVTISATGTIDRGTVTLVALLDGNEHGDPVILSAGAVDNATRYVYQAGHWSFAATASADASGSLYLAISDR